MAARLLYDPCGESCEEGATLMVGGHRHLITTKEEEEKEKVHDHEPNHDQRGVEARQSGPNQE
jgi:hypothetical protein